MNGMVAHCRFALAILQPTVVAKYVGRVGICLMILGFNVVLLSVIVC